MTDKAKKTDAPDAFISPIEDVIEDARKGRMFVLVDAEDRENEGDLVIPAQAVTPETINFMAKYGRGLVCLAMTSQRIEELGLELMSRQNRSRHETAFTVSIEAREGVTTGISAHDRARTIEVAIDPAKSRQDIVTPGHIFPLVARDGGVLVRAGHTEAAVDIARLAGFNPSGVICEIMNDDGTMARLPDLLPFAQHHGLKVGTIADLIAYRRRYDHFLTRAHETQIESEYGGKWQLVVYVNLLEKTEHTVLIKGDLSGPEPVLVRMHAIQLFSDLIGVGGSNIDSIRKSMRIIAERGRGAVVVLRDHQRSIIKDDLKAGAKPDSRQKELREYGVGAQILFDLGVRDMILLSNSPPNIVALEGYGLKVVGHHPIT